MSGESFREKIAQRNGKNVTLKVEKDEDYVVPSKVNPCLKYTMFILNYILLLFAVAMLVLGIWAQLDKSGFIKNLQKFDTKNIIVFFLNPAALIALLGAFVLVVSFCGAIGSLRDNCFYLMLYVSMMGCLVITYLMLIALAATSGRIVVTIATTTIEDTIIRYREDPDLQLFVDWVQINLKCCGAISPHDWNGNIYFSDLKVLSSFNSLEAGGVPYSCCKETSETVALQNRYCGLVARKRPKDKVGEKGPYLSKNIHPNGCISAIRSFMINNVLYIAPIVFITIISQLFCLFFACTLQNQIFEQREEWYSTAKLKIEVYDE